MAPPYDPDTQPVIAFDIGLGFTSQGQCVRRIDNRPVGRFAVYQPMQQVQYMRLGCYAGLQGQFHSAQDDLFVVMKNERKDVRHLAITARAAEHLVL